MSLLAEDLADETAANLGRIADRFAAEARDLDRPGTAPEAARRQAAAAARAATAYAVSQLAAAEAVFASVDAALAPDPLAPATIPLFRSAARMFEGGRRLCRLARELWERAVALGEPADATAELDRVQLRFRKLVREANLAVELREKGWQPADPERYEQAMQAAKEGTWIPAEELIRRYSSK